MTILIQLYIYSLSQSCIQHGKNLIPLFSGHLVFWKNGDHEYMPDLINLQVNIAVTNMGVVSPFKR
jgi:hypothetical protein